MIGLGGLRLATLDDDAAVEVITAAIDAGVVMLDTADVYGRGEGDVGRGERQCARALAARPGAKVTVVSKGGLTRPGKAWVADGRARSLAAAARASRERLAVDAIDLYLLHAVDPKVELATSVRALARLLEDGVVRSIGLSNVGRVQVEEARAIAPIAAVEVEVGLHQVDAIRGGLVRWCGEQGIAVLAYRPLGGPERSRRLTSDVELARIAERHGATAAEVVLAWLVGQGVVPLVGASTVEHVRSLGRAAPLVLDEDAIRVFERRWLDGFARATSTITSDGAALAEARSPRPEAPDLRPEAPPSSTTIDEGELVIIMGLPGAGKSTLTAPLVERGYLRLNRDLRGGTLGGLALELDRALAAGARRVVLDNTYPTRASRAPVIAAGRRHAVPVRCVWLDTTLEDAQVNACHRLLATHGRLPEPDELNRLARKDPGTFPPGVQFNHRRQFEPPGDDEGFTAIELQPFVRAGGGDGARALIVDVDDLVRVGRPSAPADVRLADGAAETLAAWRTAGWLVAGTAWQPDLVGPAADVRLQVAAIDARTAELLGAPLAIATCWHPAGPPRCWCRKPLPGLGLLLARDHGLALARSIHVGRGPADRGFAARLGAAYLEPEDGCLPMPPP